MTYHPPPFRMKGAEDSKRRTEPPHVSQVTRGGSEMRCLTSKTLSHWWHWYSYVGTNRKATCGI